MNERKERLIAAIDCCMRPGGCDSCPMLDGFCDVPFIPFVEVPEQLLTEIVNEMRTETEGRIQ
jgi:hypothetical protein